MDKKEWEAIASRAESLVALFEKDKDEMVKMYLTDSDTLANKLIAKMNLTREQKLILDDLVDILVCESYRAVLYALDGCNSIGGIQQAYKIYTEDGSLVSDGGYISGAIGDLEALEDRNTKKKEGKI